VIGSGPGGALVARSLAARGADVVVLESGPVVRPQQFSRDMGETLSKYFWEGGLRAARGPVPLPSLTGRVLGGGSVFNSAICMRMPDWGAERWRDEHGVEGCMDTDLAPYFEFMEKYLHVAPTPDEVLGTRNLLFKKGGEAMGFEPTSIERSVDGCHGSGNCLLGCKNSAKMSMDRKGIPEVLERGGRVYTSAHVDTLIMRGKRAAGVVGKVVDPVTGKKTHEVRITARTAVIVAAGAYHTPCILIRSGVQHPALGKNLRTHPGGLVMGLFDEEVNPWIGATQAFHVSKFLPEGIKLESAWTSEAIFASTFKGVGAEYVDRNRSFKHLAPWDVWVSGDDSVGSVRPLPSGLVDIQYDFRAGDARRLQEGYAKLMDMSFAAGARKVFTPFSEPFDVIYDADDVKKFRATHFTPKDFQTGSNHLFGTTRMGGNREEYPLNSQGAMRGYEGIYVCDTGMFPSTPGANPMMTLMAIAERMGEQLTA